MFNDALDDDYIAKVIRDASKFGLSAAQVKGADDMTRQDIFTARYSQAMAKTATGTAYLVVKSYTGDPEANSGGRPGIFQNPLPQTTEKNQWKTYEFGTLQQNRAIREIVSIDLAGSVYGPDRRTREGTPPYTPHIDWRANSLGVPITDPQPVVDADQIALPAIPPAGVFPPAPPAPQHKYRYKRQGTVASSIAEQTGDIAVCSAPTIPTASPAPTLSCEHQDQTPEIASEYCVCDGTATLPVLSASTGHNDPSASCAYTSIPEVSGATTATTAINSSTVASTAANIAPTSTSQNTGSTAAAVITPLTTGLGPATTNSAACSVCSPYALNGQACTSIPNCQQHTPSAYVQAGNHSVHVGTLTSMALSSSVSSALAKICPTVTQTTSMTNCDGDTVKISNVVYKDPVDATLAKGELDVAVQSSQYNSTSLRHAMINTAALTAMQSATGKNCYDVEYNKFAKRNTIPSLARRWLFGRNGPISEPVQEHMTMCMVSSFAGVQYLPEYWRQANDPKTEFEWLIATWDFKIPPSAEISCAFIAGLADALVAVAPEFAPEEVALGEEIDVACTEAMDLLSQ